EAQSNLLIEEAVISSNVEPSDILTKSSKERNIVPVAPVVNREESNQKNYNRSYDQHTLMNNGTKDTMQPIEDDGFMRLHTVHTKNPKHHNNERRTYNPFISKEIVADLRDKESTSDWDYYKTKRTKQPNGQKFSTSRPEHCSEQLKLELQEELKFLTK
ncbi:14380_t:CDS:2, partial [Gigaspora rosea]